MGPRRDRLLDALLGIALAAVGVVSVLNPAHSTEYTFPTSNATQLSLVVSAALLLIARRRWPLTTCCLVISAVFAVGIQGWYAGSAPFSILLGLYSVAAARELRPALAGLGFGYAAIGGLIAFQVPYFNHPASLLFVAAVTAAWAFGRWTRRRRTERNSAVDVAIAAERARAVAAERAVLAERLHLARELHDLVSHTLTVIAVQSGAARHRLEHGPDEDGRVVAALSAIEMASRRALDDLRRMVGVLRSDQAVDEPTGSTTTIENRPAGLVREWLVDVAIAATIAAFGLVFAFMDDPTRIHHYRAANAGLVGLILLACLPLALRRRWPVATYLVASTATITIIGAHWNPDVASLAAYIALYTVAAWRPPAFAVAGLALWVAGDFLFWAYPVPTYDPFADLGGADVLVPVVLGLVVRRWREQRDAAYERALTAERTRSAAAERAVFSERLLIAGELHDVISHTLSVVAVQAGVMHHQLGERSESIAPALAAIASASRTALADLRRMLGVLNSEAGPPPSLSPIPRLAELELLASAHRATHGPLELAIDPALHASPDSVQLTTFRLVQEALTNIGKYAPGAAARVQVRADDDRVLVAIEDDGAPARTTPIGSSGFGLVGMRERAALFGGSVDAGPRAGGGFRVEATLNNRVAV